MKNFLIILIGGWVLLSSGFITSGVKLMERHEEYKIVDDCLSGLENKLGEFGIRFPLVAIAQVLHESDKFKSPIATNCNNIIGMKVPYLRPTVATGECRSHAKYASKVDCLEDYKLYQEWQFPLYSGKLETDEDYLIFLERVRYAEDPDYISKLRYWMAIINNLKQIK